MTCKIVPDMTYNVLSGTLSLYTTPWNVAVFVVIVMLFLSVLGVGYQ